MSNDLQITIFKILGFIAQAIGFLSIGLLALSVWSAFNSVRKARPLFISRLVKSILLSAASLGVFIYFSGIHPETKQWAIWGGIGLAIGLYWASTVRVFKKEDTVYSKNSFLYLAVWSGTLVASQFFATLRSEYANASLIAAIFSSGIVLGMNGFLIKQYVGVKGTKQE